MEVMKQENQMLQWHPAFYAGIQIDLERVLKFIPAIYMPHSAVYLPQIQLA